MVSNKHLPPHIHADHTLSGWQTAETLIRYIHDVIALYSADQPSALILDEYRAHHTPAVQQAAADHHIEIITVPAGQTATLQPLDVGVNGIIKQESEAAVGAGYAEPEKHPDSRTAAVLRIEGAFNSIPASTMQSAFSKAVPSLKSMPR